MFIFCLVDIALAIITLPAWHPNVNISLSQGFTAPIYHPNVQSLLVTETGTFNNTVNHPDVDELIKSGTPLPRSHPGLEQYITYKSFDFTYKRLTIKPYWHPSIDELWRSKTSAPENHPNINQYFSNDVPLSHPNIDDIIRNPAFYNMPPYHPPIDPFVGFNSTRPISTVNLPFWHASIDQLVSSNTALPKYHPLVDQMFRNMDAFPNGHVNIDLILANPQNYEMPNYHPLIDLNVQISARPNLTDNSLPTEILVTVPYWHPNPDNMFWAMYSTPKNHPKVHSYFSANAAFPPTHPNVDEIIASPSKYTIPKGHPKINSWINTQVSPVFEEVTRVYSKLHPNIDISLASGRNVPLDHPKVAKYFSKYLPPSHPDIDEILASPSLHPFPSHWHPSINVFVGSMNPPQSVIVQKLPKWHPPVNESLSTGIAASPNHLTINDRFVGLLPDNHPDIDYIIANPTKFKIPSFHPPLSDYISYELSTSNSPLAILPIGHPDIQKVFKEGQAIPEGHISVDEFLSAVLPKNHKSVDQMIASPSAYSYPVYHPAISDYLIQNPNGKNKIISSLPYWHPKLMESYQAGIATPSRHLLFHKQFEHLLPASHPNVDSMLANPGAFKLPASHPNLDLYVSYRARFRPGHLLCIYLLLIILISSFMKLAITSLCRKTSAIEGLSLSEKDMLKLSGSGTTSNLSIAEELCMSPTPLARKELYASNGTIAQRDSIQSGVRGSVLQSSLGSSEKMVRFQDQESVIIVEKENNTKVKLNTVPPHLDMIYFKARLDEKRGQKKLYAYGASLVSLPPNELLQRKNRLKDASLITKIWYSQIPFTNISIVNIIFTILYVFLNAVALLYPNGPVDLQTGIASLSIANLIILTIPTTSWMTWLGLGNNSGSLHKYIGIWTVILALTHVSYYIPTLAFHMKEHVYWTGMGCTSALLILAITSTNYIRKNNFKVFWYGHYASLSGSLLAFMHVQETRPFVVMGFFMMVLEFGWKFWKKMPQKTMSFESKGENTVQVRLVDQGAARKPGQYYYVNFPEVSLTGWYSFWVSSGEREDGVELCIRAQNEYTSDIVKHCKLVEITGKLPWARVSGPFGGADLKIRKYPVLVLVGGGEGITPVVSILKDIYHVGKYNPALGAVTPHSMEAVYLVWVMPTVDDATVYIKEIKKSINNSSLSKFPPLVVWIYITRPKQIIEEPLMAGKPNFDRIFDAVESNHPGRSTMIFASGPLEMISEVYSEGLRREKGGCRVDFEYVSC